jgi:hypothetical protein
MPYIIIYGIFFIFIILKFLLFCFIICINFKYNLSVDVYYQIIELIYIKLMIINTFNPKKININQMEHYIC